MATNTVSNKAAHALLGRSFPSAQNKLIRSLLYYYANRTGRLDCHQCGVPILDISNFSVEHIRPWLYEPNAAELHFDLDNIAFSHNYCNSAAKRDKISQEPCTCAVRSAQLGMSYAGARKRLHRAMLLRMLTEEGDHLCSSCGEAITSTEELAISHATHWRRSQDPASAFFDLGNVTFLHRACSRRRKH